MSGRRRALWEDVAEGIRAQPGRTGLSFLALAVGIAALVVLTAVLGGLDRRAQDIVRELGVQVFAIVGAGEGGDRALDRGRVDVLAANLTSCRVAGVRVEPVRVAGDRSVVGVVSTDAHLSRVRGWTLVSGRFLDPEDLRSRARVAVLSAEVSRQWGKQVGEVMTLRTLPFRIVGVVDTGGGQAAPELSRTGVGLGSRLVFVPWTAPAPWREPTAPADTVDAVFVHAPTEPAYHRGLAASIRLLRQPDQAAGSLSWVTPDVLLAGIRRLQRMIRWTAGSVAALCLLLGGTTLMSLMVANVRDRVPEIGLRRALGATSGDIAALFVVEALVVTGLAAIAGTAAAHLLLLLPAADAFPVPVRFGWRTALAPGCCAAVMGVLFSLAPARAAAGIVPSEALRNE
jgi:putative ABC transport system permease protein